MSIIQLLPLLLPRRIQLRAVRHHHVVAAVGRGVPDGFVLAHEDHGDAGGEAAEGWRGDGADGGGRCEGADGGEAWVGGCAGYVVPGAGVG